MTVLTLLGQFTHNAGPNVHFGVINGAVFHGFDSFDSLVPVTLLRGGDRADFIDK